MSVAWRTGVSQASFLIQEALGPLRRLLHLRPERLHRRAWGKRLASEIVEAIGLVETRGDRLRFRFEGAALADAFEGAVEAARQLSACLSMIEMEDYDSAEAADKPDIKEFCETQAAAALQQCDAFEVHVNSFRAAAFEVVGIRSPQISD
jgi:hypothetical protein